MPSVEAYLVSSFAVPGSDGKVKRKAFLGGHGQALPGCWDSASLFFVLLLIQEVHGFILLPASAKICYLLMEV